MDEKSIAHDPHCYEHGHLHDRSSRRKFLASIAAASAAAPFTRNRATAADGSTGDGSKLIDTHHHFYPPTYQKAWADWEDQHKIPHLGVQLAWNRDADI